jgi:signal transduction histidine kinase
MAGWGSMADRSRRIFRCLILCLAGFSIPPCQAQEVPKTTPLANVKAIPFDANKGTVQVTTEGAVVWQESSPSPFLYVQDKRNGIRVRPAAGEPLPALGDSVKLTGLMHWSDHSVEIIEARFEISGHSGLPKAKRISAASMATGVADGTRVHVRGYLRQAYAENSRVSLTVDCDGVRVRVVVAGEDSIQTNDFLGQYVFIDGVVVPRVRQGDFEIFVPSFDHLYFRNRTHGNDSPLIAIQDLFRYRKGYNWGDRVRIRGQILGISGDDIHVNDGTGGIVVRADVSGFSAGDWVDALGFPEFEDGLKVFSDAVLTKSASDGNIPPQPTHPRELLDPAAHHRFVTVRGRLVDFMKSPSEGENGTSITLTLVMNSDGTIFTANALRRDPIPKLEMGSLIRVSGIVQMDSYRNGLPGSFSLLSFDPDGIFVEKGPGFFTERRLLFLLCIALLCLAVTGFGAYIATKKSAKLHAEVRERKAINTERARLAGDIHDTLQQILTAIHLQLHALGPTEDLPAAAAKSLTSVRDLVRQCHVEIRNLVWDLRPAALEEYDLARALERMAASLVLGTPTKISVTPSGNVERIPSLIEDNLLRVGQEALTNAVKHGQASVIEIRLEGRDRKFRLEIEDDGHGIPAQFEEGFGLRSMKERVARIGGTLDISAGKNGGTRVSVEIPRGKTLERITTTAGG